MRGPRRILMCAVATLLLAAFAWTSAEAVEFGTPIPYPADNAPHDVAAGDFNGDGIPDLAVANNLSGDVSILIGNGNGSFKTAVNYTAGSFPTSLAVADFNQDGHLDIVVTNSNNFLSGANISILLGNGDGTFQAPVNYASTLGAPYFVAVSDLRSNGLLDLAVANHGGQVAIYLGNGDGTFQPAVNYVAGGNPQAVSIGDFNNDHIPDLAVANKTSNNVSILLGKGDGTFQKAVNYQVGTAPSDVATGDFNADGNLDLAISNYGSNNVAIMLGTGTGTFGTPAFTTVGNGPAGIVVADFNGDGKADFAEANNFRSADSVWVFLGHGDGTFQAPANYSAGGGAGLLAAADLNLDGAPDLEIADTGADVDVLMNNGGTFVTTTSSSNPSFVGSAVTFTATVAASIAGNPTPTGSVTFENGSSLLGTANLASGQGSFTTSTLAAGTFTINTLYSGDSNFNPNTAPPLIQTVNFPPAVTITPTTLTFGVQLLHTTSTVLTATLTDSGQGPLTITSIMISGSFAQTNNCGSGLGAGGSCTISVTFTPTGINKSVGTVTISDNAPGSPQTISLTGMGTEVQLVPTTLSFGTQKVGTSSPAQTVTLTNVGKASLSITQFRIGGANAADFAQTNTCGSSVSAGGSCSISVTFTPKATGSRIGAVGVVDNGGGSPQVVGLSGTGD
jgi:hypothetical protein